MTTINYDLFVIGGNHHNALGVIRSLGEKGIRPYVIIQCDEKNPYIGKSKYIHQCWVVKTDEEVLDILRQKGELQTQKAILIACSDNLSSLVDMHHNELAKYYMIPGTEEQGRITYLMDKEVMSQLARQIGFHVPRSMATDTSNNVEIHIPIPWIIKPLVSKNGVKADIERIYSKSDWDDYKSHHQLKVQVQQLIEKDYEYQLIGLSLDSGREVIIPGVSHVIRPQATTNTGFLRYESLNESYGNVLSLSKRFLKETGYSGLFSLEILRGMDGRDYFMEVNFRNDGNAICVTESGVNLPYIWYLYQTGADYQKEYVGKIIKPTYVMPEFADVRLLFQQKLKVVTWLKDIHKTNRFMEFDKKDKIPFIYLLIDFFTRGAKKILLCR